MTIQGKDPIPASRHRFGELMAAARAAFGMALGEPGQLGGGKTQNVTSRARTPTPKDRTTEPSKTSGDQLTFRKQCAIGVLVPESVLTVAILPQLGQNY